MRLDRREMALTWIAIFRASIPDPTTDHGGDPIALEAHCPQTVVAVVRAAAVHPAVLERRAERLQNTLAWHAQTHAAGAARIDRLCLGHCLRFDANHHALVRPLAKEHELAQRSAHPAVHLLPALAFLDAVERLFGESRCELSAVAEHHRDHT